MRRSKQPAYIIETKETVCQGLELKQAWGNWLTELGDQTGGWDWWFTGTFRDIERQGTWDKPGWAYTGFAWIDFQQYLGLGLGLLGALPEGALTKRGTLRRDLGLTRAQAVLNEATMGVKWVRGREYQHWRGVPHFHALVGGVGNLRRDEAWAWWFERYGWARIEPYDRSLGAGFYLCKYVVKELGDIQFSQGLTVCQQRGNIVTEG